MRIACIWIAVSCTIASAAQAQHWEEYLPGRIRPIIEERQAILDQQRQDTTPTYVFSGRSYPTRATLVYTGTHRPLSPIRSQIVHGWLRFLGTDSTLSDIFKNEYLFREDSLELWMAVQETLEPSLAEEATPGQTITVLTVLAGGYRAQGVTTRLFAVNEFDAGRR